MAELLEGALSIPEIPGSKPAQVQTWSTRIYPGNLSIKTWLKTMGLIYLENTIFFSIWVASLNGLYSYTYSPYNYITLLNELRHIKFQYIFNMLNYSFVSMSPWCLFNIQWRFSRSSNWGFLLHIHPRSTPVNWQFFLLHPSSRPTFEMAAMPLPCNGLKLCCDNNP